MDIELHYEERGAGEPLILLHGNGSDCSYFSGQMDAFARRFRTIALDTRGHGASPRGKKPFTISQFADDLADFMDERGIARAHLLGFSDGGNIALVFALRHPDRVGRLVLNGANLFFDGLTPEVRRDMIEHAHSRHIAEALPQSRMVVLPGSHFVAEEDPAAFNEAVLAFLEP